MTVRVVRVGATQAVTTVRVGDSTVTGAALISGVGAVKLDELTDVDGATAATVGAVLVKQSDGTWRPAVIAGAGPFVHTQAAPQSVTPVEHGRGYRPASVSLFSLDFAQQFSEFRIQHVSTIEFRIIIDQPTPFVALIS